MNPNIVTWLTYPETGPEGEINTKPSMTEPNMLMPLSEMIERYVSGREVPQFQGSFSDLDLPDPRTMDLVDFDIMKNQNKEYMEKMENELSEKRSKRTSPKKQAEGPGVRPEDDTSHQNASAKKESDEDS